MKKRILSLILALAMLCALLPQAALTASAETYSGSCGAAGDNLTWSLDTTTGLLTITGSGKMADYKSPGNLAPWYDYRRSITAVSLPEGLTSIGDYAFDGCMAMTSVTIPDSVTGIGRYAFFDCSALTSVTIPDSVTGIGNHAFSYCSALTGVTIPASVTSIGNYAFYYCTALTGVTIPDSVTSIGVAAFSGTAYCNYSNNWDGQLLYIGSWLIMAKNVIESADIKQGTTGIADYAFYDCSALTGVTIPSSVTGIGAGAFYGCSALTGVTIPSSVTGIGAGAFYGCSALTSVTIPDSVTSIGDSAFEGCSALTGVTIPSSVTSIGVKAFGYYYDNGYQKIDGFTIYGYPGTAAESYATENGFSFVPPYAATVARPMPGQHPVSRGLSGDPDVFTVAVVQYFPVKSDGSLGAALSETDVFQPNQVYRAILVLWPVGNWQFSRSTPVTVNGVEATFLLANSGNGRGMYCADLSCENPFEDVTEADYFFNPVMWALGHLPQVTAGVDAAHFGPNNNCTREQIVTFLWAANGKPAPAGTGSTFSDVPADAWYYQPVMWAVENKVTSGLPDGSFGVGQPCTRAQAMTFLWASQGKPAPSSMESTFSDVSSSDWFCKAILWAAENGITKGVGDGLFGVNNTCTRAQIITFLYKAYK